MCRSHYLSKSLYIKGLQCQKALWLQKYQPELKDEVSENQQAAFDTGTDIGILAQQLFPGGVEVPYDGLSPSEQLEMTNKLMVDGVETLYEAAFSFNNTFCKVDILHRSPDGWELYEVKGSTGCKDVYLNDIALQHNVLSGTGTIPVRSYLVHLNKTYIRQGDIDVQGLFTKLDVTKDVVALQEDVKANLEALRTMLSGEMPNIDIGPHCSSPYECVFAGHCWSHIPENSVFNFRGHGKPNAWQLYGEGILKIEDVPDERLGWRQKLQQRGLREEFLDFDRDEINNFFEQLSYPLSFMDFETIYMVPVPMWDGIRPYQQVPFQFSLHVIDELGRKPHHFEFLADQCGDPRLPFLKALLASLPKEGNIVTWNAPFESSRLRELAAAFPESKESIDGILERIVDLMVPFRNKSIYHSGFDGSYSVKYVLPALVPELSYSELAINNGEMASSSWLWHLQCKDKDEFERTRSELLDYCRMDTLAMVRILEKMQEIIKQ